MIAKSGASLLRPDAVESLRRVLLPLALVVTPNLPEASALTGRDIRTEREMEEAARAILALGSQSVVVKGGHFPDTDESVDLFFDGREFRRFRARTTRCASARARIAELCFLKLVAGLRYL